MIIHYIGIGLDVDQVKAVCYRVFLVERVREARRVLWDGPVYTGMEGGGTESWSMHE